MKHDRPLVPSLCLILQVESDRQLEIELHCGTLELAHQGIIDCDVNLGTVESAVTGVHLQ